MDNAGLARKNLERRFKPLRELHLQPPSRGWLRAIRESIGMTTRQFAKRLGVVPSRITALEKAEAHGNVTLKTLREAAETLDCVLVYAIIPNNPLDDMMRARAITRADAELQRVDHTMQLENQGLTRIDLSAARERKINALLEGSPRRLWDDQ